MASAYLIAGLLWIGVSDLALAVSGGLSDMGLLVAAGKGAIFVLLSAGFVFWLCRREFSSVARTSTLLHAVVEGTTDAVYVKDLDGRHLLVNAAAARFVGRTVAEVLGRGAHELFEAADADRLVASDRAIMDGGEVVTLEETLAAGGLSRTYQATKAPYRDTNGNVIGLVGISRDITEAKRAEQALAVSEARYRTLVDNATDAIFLHDESGVILDANPAACESLGLTRQDLLGTTPEAFDPEVTPDKSRSILDSLDAGVALSLDTTHRRRDGTTYPAEVRIRPFWADGRRFAISTSRDISERKRAERFLRETESRLREAQRIARMGSWSWEPSTGQVWWSDALYELFGQDRSTFSPSFDAFLGLLHPDDRHVAIARVEAMRAGSNEFANDLRIVRPDGTWIWIHSRAQATRDSSEKLVRVEGTDQDVTAQHIAERAIRESEERFRTLIEFLPDAVFLNTGGVVGYANWACSRLFGVPAPTDLYGKSPFDLIHPDYHADVRERIAYMVDTKRPVGDLVEEVLRADGTRVPVRVTALPVHDHTGPSILVVMHDLTERRQVEADREAAAAALGESEERFQEAARVAGVGVFEHDHRTESFYWSPRLREIYGYDPDAPVDLDAYLALIHPADRDAIAAAVRKAHDPDGDGRYDVEHRMIRPTDGQVRWLTTQSQTRFAGHGPNRRPIRTVGATVDVTEARDAAEALRNSEERYRRLLAVLPTAVLIHDVDRSLYCNAAFVRLLGADSTDEVLKHRPFDCLHQDDRPLAYARLAAMAASGEAAPGVEMRLVRQDGRSVRAHTVSAPITGYGGPAYLVALSDLSERERAMELLRSVLSSVGDAILTIDARGTVTSANRATERLFGYAEAELLAGNVNVLMPQPHHQDHDRYVADYLRTGMARVIGVGREVDGRRKDGSTFPAELTVTEFARDGERHFTGVIRDISARRRLQEQFRQAQKMEAVGRLAGGVAHDFNNLLTVINGYASMLIDGLSVGDPSREMLAEIQDAGERAARLTQQLLAFSRKSVVKPRLVDLNDLVTESAKLLRRLIGEDIGLAVLHDPAPVWVEVDPGQLEQVLMNLAVNARDAMPTGGRLTIETRTVQLGSGVDRSHPDLPPGRYASLRMVDTGCGMSEEVRERIFEPFFTTKGVGKGTGLGLAVVHGVVKQSGGSVAVESAVGSGTAFTVLFPIATRLDAGPAPVASRVAPRGNETILLVEDETSVRTLARVSLEGMGYSVLTAVGGAAALELLRAHPDRVDLLVTDVVMPGMSGRELAETARNARPELRILFW